MSGMKKTKNAEGVKGMKGVTRGKEVSRGAFLEVGGYTSEKIAGVCGVLEHSGHVASRPAAPGAPKQRVRLSAFAVIISI